MPLEGLKQYFETYIKKYTPYLDSDIYSALTTYLENVYFKDGYLNIPYTLGRIVNDNIIDTELFNNYLLSFGIPNYIVYSLTNSEKAILLQITNDLNRLKSTLEFTKRLSTELANDVALYELYITRLNSEWFFIPRLIYASESIRSNPEAILKTLFPYNEIYYKADYYYVTEAELESLYQTSQIVLPIKTNLLLLDFFVSYNDTSLYNRLIEYICLSEIGNELTNVQFFEVFGDYTPQIEEDTEITTIADNPSIQFPVRFRDLLSIYYLVYLKFYEDEFNIHPVYQGLVISSTNANIYSVDDIKQISLDYDNIKTRDDWVDFYNKYLREFANSILVSSPVFSVNELESAIIENNRELNEPVINYINARIKHYTYQFIPRINIYKSILDEIKNALLTFVLNLDM